MKLFNYIGYFSQLCSLIGFKAGVIFTVVHIKNKMLPPSSGSLARVPVGPYIFYFPSVDFFDALFTEIFFKETYYLAPANEPVHIIDCGANIGLSLLYFKIRAPHADVVCFEPNPAARAVLEKNVAANGWEKDVRILPYALGNKKGTVDFFVDEKEATSSGGSTSNHQKNKNQSLTSYPVEIDLLSHYIDQPIDLLKIDIEGPEFDVLEEVAKANKLISVSALQLEYHYIPGSFTRPLSDMLTLLESNGFHTFVESNTLPHKIIGTDVWHTYMVFAWR